MLAYAARVERHGLECSAAGECGNDRAQTDRAQTVCRQSRARERHGWPNGVGQLLCAHDVPTPGYTGNSSTESQIKLN